MDRVFTFSGDTVEAEAYLMNIRAFTRIYQFENYTLIKVINCTEKIADHLKSLGGVEIK